VQELIRRWPVVRQILDGGDGTGPEAMSEATRDLQPRTSGAGRARSVCPYCGVGCGQIVFHRDGKIIAVEGDEASPISRGRLCPKGAATHQLLTHPRRELKARYRAPYATTWQEIDLEKAMDMIAGRVWDTRARTFEETRDGEVLMQYATIGHIGGATLDNEENYLIKKLFTGGLGMVNVTNQARI
jgi:formate dehydrogenase major subunit